MLARIRTSTGLFLVTLASGRGGYHTRCRFPLASRARCDASQNGHDSLKPVKSPLLTANRLPVRMLWLGDKLWTKPDYREL